MPKIPKNPAPNPALGVQDSGHTGSPPVPTRRADASQDFGDRDIGHTAQDLQQRSSSAPTHGTPAESTEEKRRWNPD